MINLQAVVVDCSIHTPDIRIYFQKKINVFWIGFHQAWHMVIMSSYKTGASLGQSRLSLCYYITLSVGHPMLDLVQRKPGDIYLTNSPP